MKTLTSKVQWANKKGHELACAQAQKAMDAGGAFEIKDRYDGQTWFTEYTIHWPEPKCLTDS